MSVSGSTNDNTGRHVHTSGSTNENQGHVHSITDQSHSHSIVTYLVENNVERSAGILGDDDRRTSASTSLGTQGQFTGITATNSDGKHSHALTVNNNGSEHNHALTATGTATHNHDLDGNTAASLGDHDHTAQTTGDDVPHENRPPYYALVYLIQYK